MSEAAIENEVISPEFVALCKGLDSTADSAEEHEANAQREQRLADDDWKICSKAVYEIKEQYMEDNVNSRGPNYGWYRASARISTHMKLKGEHWARRMVSTYVGYEQVISGSGAAASDASASVYEDIGKANLTKQELQKVWRDASEAAAKHRESGLPTRQEVRKALKRMKITKPEREYRKPAIHLAGCLERMRLLDTEYKCDGKEIYKRMLEQSDKGRQTILDNLDWAINLLTEIKEEL